MWGVRGGGWGGAESHFPEPPAGVAGGGEARLLQVELLRVWSWDSDEFFHLLWGS